MDTYRIDWYIFDECDLRDQDLSERNLVGAHFIKADARGTFFIKSQLKGAHFEGADLRNAYFVGANLRNAHFEGADLRGAIFTWADLRGAFLQGSITDECTTWDDAQMGDYVEEMPSHRITDGIPKIDFEELLMEAEVSTAI